MKGAPRRRVVAVVAAAAAIVTAGQVAVAAQAATYPPYPAKLVVKSELRFKANLIRDNLERLVKERQS